MAAAKKFAEKWAIYDGSTNTVLNADEGSDMGLDDVVRNGNGITGRRSPAMVRMRQGERMASGNLSLLVNGSDLDVLLPFITGGTKGVGDLYSLANTVSTFSVKRHADTQGFTYSGCKINQATFAAASKGFLKVGLGIMGADESEGAVSLADRLDTKSPYVFEDGVFEIEDDAYSVDGMVVTIGHNLVPKFFNNLTPQRFTEGPRDITVELQFPYGDAAALRNRAVTGSKFEATFTNGSDIFKIQVDSLVYPKSRLTLSENEFGFTLRGLGCEVIDTGAYVQPIKFYNTVV